MGMWAKTKMWTQKLHRHIYVSFDDDTSIDGIMVDRKELT